ncbi:tail fibers protein [Escherichia phage C600M2]|uniref:Tail fibers protein n=1 Tax=Escherichia phage CL1 TaxID=2851028 RepID=A0AC61TDA6_9CAUD|nr:tail fibers protein [Escherichia phage CL1]UCJ01372.1 tail fibers protein [Escherichia phage C600M2]
MADYKLSELNSIDTIRSDDLLHVRVKKRPEMLGDEDRRMTYQDFLASFKLERFVQIAGSTMTGDLGIVKLLYGGKVVFDPTGSSGITMGDVLKTFKINANGLKLTIADASRSATVYHTLNKPSPNELGMRTNEENDARYARLAVNNTFRATQNILSDNETIIVKNVTQGMPLYIRGQDADGSNRWYLGNDNKGTDNLVLKNVKSGAYVAILDSLITVNKSIQITGQVQPSDFSNLDARYFTQTAANQRFAQLVGNNTFRGINNFVGEFNITRDNAVLVIKNATAATGLYLLGQKADGTNKFYLGTDDSDSVVNLHNYTTSTTISLSNVITTTKTVKITGQVQPSDWANIDSRYIPAGTLSNLAKLSDANTFRSAQIINRDGSLLQLKNTTQDGELYFAGHNADGVRRWYIGNGESSNPERLIIHNGRTATTIYMQDDFLLNKTVRIIGQVQPSDWTNLDARYYVQSATDAKYIWSAVRETVRAEDGGVAWNKPSGIYLETVQGGGANRLVSHMFVNTGASTPAAQLMFGYRNGGMWYRTARDRAGFEEDWSKVYTEAQKPTPSEIGAYTKTETDQKIAQAVSDSTDLNKIYPVGIVTWFNSNVDPNTALPGLTWTYLNNGVGRTIRIAAANGSDVATTGGSDSVTLAVGNLPSHTHRFSATTSSFDYGTKNTNTTGAHTHSVSGSTSSAGNHNHSISWIGQNSQHYSGGGGAYVGSGPGYTDANGAHTHTISGTAASAGNHAHSVGIGAHSHTVSGNTGGTGSGSAFSVTNQFYKLMAWVRTA